MVTIPDQLNDLQVGILLHEPETGDIVYVNEYAEDLYGYTEAEMKRMDVGDFSSDSFSNSEAVQRMQAAVDGHPQQFEWQNKRSTGELYWVEVRLSKLTVEETEYVVALVQDITEYKMNLRHLRVLTRITRHNLRNKLNVIKGGFDHIERQTEGSEMLDRMGRSIGELLSLTNWIDTIKSVSSNTPSESCNICELLGELEATYREEYPTINWQFDCDQCYVTADATLRTAVNELIDNAVAHNPHEGLDIIVSVTERPADQQICIEITDTGRPIPEIEIEPLVSGYDPNPLEHGEKIGLWEAQTIINAHRGRLSVKENNAEQKTLKITLPRATPETAS